MRFAPAFPAAGLLLVIGLAGSVVAQPAASDAPMEVTSDTPEYCLQLADRLHSSMVRVAAAKMPREVPSLSNEGQKMCANGQTRGGIMRLRKALLLLMQDETPPRK
jgi:hypothetical protein